MDEIAMTPAELERLRAELTELEGDGRSAIAARIKTAREWGDLKENAEYHAAKEAQAHLETKIQRLQHQLRSAVVVDGAVSDEVRHGSSVEATDLGTDKSHSYKIVSPNDAKPREGLISASSPIATALLGLKVGEVASVETPKGERRLRIDAIA
ncbi:MAG: transcription elongation factor GreA [Solirubrobacterales bacterium]|nr:transcription elongation factor GreA [Solirubrobacterales bacterium]